MSVYDTRRASLRRLISEWGGPLALSKKLGYANASFVVQMSGPKPVREVSERTARRIERALDLPAGWMDGEVKENPKLRDVDLNLLNRVVQRVNVLCEETHAHLSPAKMAEVVTLTYQIAADKGQVDDAFARRMISLAK